MEKIRHIIEQSLDINYWNTKLYLRKMGSFLSLGLAGFLVIYFSVLGLLLAFFFIFNPVSSFVPYRDLLIFGFLSLFGTLFVWVVSTGITGIFTPYASSDHHKIYLLQRIPIEPSVLYLSNRFDSLLRTLVISMLFTILFGPLVVVVQIPWWRIGGVFAALFISVDFCITSGQLAFFIFRRFQSQKNWMYIWTDLNSLVIPIVFLAVPAIAFLMLWQGIFPSFASLAIFPFLPLISNSLAFTGFFFRSGIPDVSWIALVMALAQLIILNIIVGVLAVNYNPLEDLMDTLPVLKFLDSQRSHLFGGNIINFNLVDDDTQGERRFIGKKPWKAYLLKDWLAMKRIRALRTYLYSIPLIVGATIIVYFLLPPEISLYSLIPVVFAMADFAFKLTQLDSNNPLQRFPISKWKQVRLKFSNLVLGLGFLSVPLVIAKGPISLIIVLFIAGISVMFEQIRLRLPFTPMILGGIGMALLFML
ncbi:MAG: hypothetical protein ACFFC7_22645 [Candidatus Hermodarchaeota archaeon]